MGYSKNIKAVVEIGANYAFHLAAVARAGFDSEYADKYRDTVHPDDLAFLEKHRQELSFGGGSKSELVAPVIAWPAYFNLATAELLAEQFDLLDRALTADDYQPFLDRYAGHIKKLDHWWYSLDAELLKIFKPHADLIRDLGRILTRNIDTYIESVWPQEVDGMNDTARAIHAYFKKRDFIGEWESLTGLTFKFDTYEIVLSSAIRNGPNANSLGYDRVVFDSGMPRGAMMEFISHEIGTHLLIDILKEIAALNKFEFSAVYEAYELLARYYNTLILERSPLSYPMSKFHIEKYLEIFKEIANRRPEISPGDLLLETLETHNRD